MTTNTNMSEDLELDMPEGESDEYVSPEDLFVKRDEHGEVLPIEEKAAPFGKVLVKPIVYGRLERLQNDGGLEKLDARTVVALLSEHFVKPDLTGLDEDALLNDMPAMAPQILLLALFRASGVTADIDVDADGEATVSLNEGN